MNEIISFINKIDDFLILLPWALVYYMSWKVDSKNTNQ
jgi:hypothetical protein